MAIVTGAQLEDVQCVLASSPAGEHLPLLVTEEDVERGKPDPEGFLKGSALLGLDPEQILVFEDSVPGLRAATAAGMPCIGVSGGRGVRPAADRHRRGRAGPDPVPAGSLTAESICVRRVMRARSARK
jgi:beta-phosphoglucomutase-like phosphatase (HAD superfamily)